jgi:hypothetical protein
MLPGWVVGIGYRPQAMTNSSCGAERLGSGASISQYGAPVHQDGSSLRYGTRRSATRVREKSRPCYGKAGDIVDQTRERRRKELRTMLTPMNYPHIEKLADRWRVDIALVPAFPCSRDSSGALSNSDSFSLSLES